MCLRSHASMGLTPSGQTPHTQLRFQGWPFLLTPKQPPPVRSHQGNPWVSPEESPRHPEGKAAGPREMGILYRDRRTRRSMAGGGSGVQSGQGPGDCR